MSRSKISQVAHAEYPPTRAEEIANAITHGIGLVLSMVGLVLLIRYALAHGRLDLIIGCSVFGGSMVLTYGASTFYHAWREPTVKRILLLLDHIAIYTLIAGTYTPLLLAFFTPGWQITMLCILWGLALTGAVYKIFFIGRFPRLSLALYLAMGWMIVLAVKPLLTFVPTGCLLWLGIGGLCYTLGVIFFTWNRLPFNHAIWHLFVLAGSACHYYAVATYVVG